MIKDRTDNPRGLYLDRDAETPDGRGAYVTSPVVKAWQFLTLDRLTVTRGVMETADGERYTITLRAPGHGDTGSKGERRLCTRERHGRSLRDLAAGLLDAEIRMGNVAPEFVTDLRAEIAEL